MASAARFVPAIFVLLWATGFIGARYAMPWAEPFGFLAARFGIAFVILALLVALLRSRRLSLPDAGHAIFAGALIHGVYLGGVFWAIRHGLPAGLTALIIGLQPLITATMAGWGLGEKVTGRHWTGLAIGFAGILIVLLPKIGDLSGGITVPTVAACVLGALAISAGTVWQKRFVAGADLVTGTMWQYLGAAAVMLVAALTTETGRFELTGELVFALAWLVFVLSIGAIFLLMWMIREGEMSKVSSLFYLVPAVTAVIAWVLFGETLNPIQLVGMAVTTIGVWMATRR